MIIIMINNNCLNFIHIILTLQIQYQTSLSKVVWYYDDNDYGNDNYDNDENSDDNNDDDNNNDNYKSSWIWFFVSIIYIGNFN